MSVNKNEAARRLRVWQRKRQNKSSPPYEHRGYCGWYRGFYFRSLLELSFITEFLEPHNKLWTGGEDQDLAIPYVDQFDVTHNYFVDFVILDDLLFVECKPHNQFQETVVQLKKKAAIAYCEKIGFKYRLMEPAMMSREKAVKLWSDGAIELSPDSNTIFKKKYFVEIRNIKNA